VLYVWLLAHVQLAWIGSNVTELKTGVRHATRDIDGRSTSGRVTDGRKSDVS
jgi:hypothetical protein